jgi:hypothetical protein
MEERSGVMSIGPTDKDIQMADLQKIVDDLSKLSVLDAADLAKMLEQKWSGAGSGPASTLLFEDCERTRKEPLRRGESLFDFYDSSASHGYDEFRLVVNRWLAQMPAGDRNELISRLRYGGRSGVRGFASELSLHAFILDRDAVPSRIPKSPDQRNGRTMLRPTKQARRLPT